MQNDHWIVCRVVDLRAAGVAAVALGVVTGVCTAAGAAGCGFVPPLPRTLEVPISENETARADIGTGPPPLADSVWVLTRAPDETYPLLPGRLLADALRRAAGGSPSKPAPASRSSGGSSRHQPLPYGRGSEILGRGSEIGPETLRRYFPRPEVGETIFVVHFGDQGQMVEVTENEYLLPRLYGTELPVGGRWVATPLPGLAFRSESYGLSDGPRYGVAARFQVRLLTCRLARAIVYSYGEIADGRSEGVFGYTIDFTDGLFPFLGIVEDEYPAAGERVE